MRHSLLNPLPVAGERVAVPREYEIDFQQGDFLERVQIPGERIFVRKPADVWGGRFENVVSTKENFSPMVEKTEVSRRVPGG